MSNYFIKTFPSYDPKQEHESWQDIYFTKHGWNKILIQRVKEGLFIWTIIPPKSQYCMYICSHTLEYLIFLHHEPGHLQTFQAFKGYLTGEHFPKHLSQKSRAGVNKAAHTCMFMLCQHVVHDIYEPLHCWADAGSSCISSVKHVHSYTNKH